MAQLHNHILELEKYVSELEPKTGYALSLLAKVCFHLVHDALTMLTVLISL